MHTNLFGLRVRTFRTRLGYSFADLADAAEISESHVRNLENGNRAPTMQSLAKLANALHVPAECLLTDKDPSELSLNRSLNDVRTISNEKLNLLLSTIEALCRNTTESEECLVGTRVRNLRIAKGLSQKQLAETLEISTSHLANLENGNEPISISMIQRLCNVLNVSISQIMCDVTREDKILELNRLMVESRQQLDSETYKHFEGLYMHIINML